MLTDAGNDGHFDAASVQNWLKLLYGNTAGYVSIVSTVDWQGKQFKPENLPLALEYIERLNSRPYEQGGAPKGIYARVTTLKQVPKAGRGSDEDSLMLPGLWADMDIAGPGHKTTKTLPNTLDDCKEIITEAGLPDPSLWVSSGGGFYPWWLFNTPWSLDTPEFLAFAQETSRTWQDAIAASAKELGFHYGPVPDLARVLRIPGTVNWKVEVNPRPCRIIEQTDLRYTAVDIATVADFAAQMLAERQPPAPPAATRPLPLSGTVVGGTERPGDALAAKLSWEQILAPAGYRLSHRRGPEEYWVRPGKDPRDGHSVTTNYAGSDLMWVFSTECEGFDSDTSYTKFATWSILNGYGLDFSAAARAIGELDIIQDLLGGDYTPPPPPRPAEPGEAAPRPKRPYDHSDTGNGHRMRDFFGHKYRYVSAYNGWMYYDGQAWQRDETHRVSQAAEACTELMYDQADEMERNLDPTDEKAVKALEAFRKHIKTSRSDRSIKAAINRFAGQRGISVTPDDFDKQRNLITVDNGVLDLDTFQLHEHRADFMLTRTFNATYNPGADCPRWKTFLEQVLPNPEVRAYVQRAMGYTLLGQADRRVMFLLYGPSGTGKSQFTEALAHIFKDFGQTAAASTFRKKHGNAAATNDLHGLKGKRLITSSETSETSELDEELLKRFTGRDQITSRDLYEKFQSWIPEGIVWLTTNYLPKLSSDDNAVWLRVKPVEFAQVFAGTMEDQPNIGVRIAEEESAGILNWLLEGVSTYRSVGLQEPEQVTQSSADHRRESDNVAQFLEESLDDGLLVREEGAEQLKCSLVFDRYEHWCKQNRITPLGIRRFNQRVTSHGFAKLRRGGYYYWLGLRVNDAHGLMGTMT
jgi:P4 family phage/plasmid primase-like protien